MSSKPKQNEELREKIIAQPDFILDDQGLMHALITANEREMGGNIVDLRGIAMKRLEARLDRLEDTHRSVIAAAYENLAGANQIHRAILRMMEAKDFETFLKDLEGDVASTLRVNRIKLLLETTQEQDSAAIERLGDVLVVVKQGFVAEYLQRLRHNSTRPVTLRQLSDGDPLVYGPRASQIKSEACLMMDFGDGRLPGMLVLGSDDPHQFSPQQGTDLLMFFAGVFERTMRRWLA